MVNIWKKIKVTEENKSLDVYVPNTDDRIEARDLEQFAVEKTKDDLRNKWIFNRKKKMIDKEEARETLKEARAYGERKRSGTKKYF